jgi:hypothetical protein
MDSPPSYPWQKNPHSPNPNYTQPTRVLSFLLWLRNANRWHPNYPTGRSRLETVAVMACALVMACATVLVIRECIGVLIDGARGG